MTSSPSGEESGRIVLRDVAADDADVLALLEPYFAELRARLGSYEPPTNEQLRAEADRGVTIVGYEKKVPVSCGSLRRLDRETAEVKRMFVAAPARGRGYARRLLAALEEHARELGYRRVVLDTAAPLTEAAAMYVREGYVAIERYNDNPVAAHWFEKRL